MKKLEKKINASIILLTNLTSITNLMTSNKIDFKNLICFFIH